MLMLKIIENVAAISYYYALLERDLMDQDRDDKKINNEQTDRSNIQTYTLPDWFIQTRNAIYYILGVIEVLIAFRLVFKLLGASTASSFVVMVYSITKALIAPFSGIFRTFITSGAQNQFVFEPAAVIAMIVYAIIAKGIVNLVRLRIPDGRYR